MPGDMISELTAISSLADDDEFLVVDTDASATKRIPKACLKSTLGAQSRWELISATKYTATPLSTSQITMSDTSDFAVGLPAKYTYGGSTYYGIVTALVANTSITIAGATLNVGADLTALYVGTAEMVIQHDFFVSGTYGDGAADLLDADMNTAFAWQRGVAYLVAFSCKHKADDSGANQPKVNVKVNASAVSTNDGGNGVQVGTAWQANSAVAIDTTKYDINRAEAVEVACTVAGSNGDATNLTVTTVWVLA